MVEVGSLIIATDPCTNEDDPNEDFLIVGKYYEVMEVNKDKEEFVIVSETHDHHTFDFPTFYEFFSFPPDTSEYEFQNLTDKFKQKYR